MPTMTEREERAGKMIKSFFGSVISRVHAGDQKIVSGAVQTTTAAAIAVTSRTFGSGGPIPERNSPQGENVSPDVEWSGAPAGTKEFVLIVEDPDAPMLNPFVHWIVHRIAGTTTAIPAGLPGERALVELGNAVQGTNNANTRGWFGPKPPTGHGVHHYHFQLFAVDQVLGLGPDATVDELKKAMTGHVIGFGELIGTYERTVDTK